MMDINQPNDQPRQQLLRQQRTEWNQLLGHATATRLALYARQQRESLLDQLSPGNGPQRLDLARQHQRERDALREGDRNHRMATLKRHTQEAAALTELQA